MLRKAYISFPKIIFWGCKCLSLKIRGVDDQPQKLEGVETSAPKNGGSIDE